MIIIFTIADDRVRTFYDFCLYCSHTDEGQKDSTQLKGIHRFLQYKTVLLDLNRVNIMTPWHARFKFICVIRWGINMSLCSALP